MKIALDTNLWSYIANKSEGASFEAVARTHGLEVVLNPSMLLEALQTRDPDVHLRIIVVMTSRMW
jgi:hypothetical protein